MPNIGPMIAASAELGLGYAARLMKDVTESKFARFANVGGVVIESNHPAFILGHLSLYSSRIISDLGGDASAHMPTPDFENVFSKDAKCVDDPDGSIYPAMDAVTSAFHSGYEAAVEIIRSTEDDVFMQENPNEVMRKRFSTIGAMHGFYVGGHIMMHMGQLSAWRRAAGLGAA